MLSDQHQDITGIMCGPQQIMQTVFNQLLFAVAETGAIKT